jgi:hypothetical protein
LDSLPSSSYQGKKCPEFYASTGFQNTIRIHPAGARQKRYVLVYVVLIYRNLHYIKVMGMRLLEFNRDDGGANPQQAVREQPRRKAPAAPVERPRKPAHVAPELFANRKAKVFPVKTSTTRKPIRRGPIDLEQLQHRIAMLEHRIQTRAEQTGEHPAVKELEFLKQRMKLLERNLENELWAARQREHTMLEILSRRPLKIVLQQKLMQLWRGQLPATGRWLQAVGREWWNDTQPRWWPHFAQAWRESLEKARH